MATSGSFSSSFGTNNGYKFIIEWKRNSTNIANNTSNVTVTAYMQSSGSSYTIISSVTKNGSMTINGTTYNFTFSAALSGGQKKQIYSKTVDIAHNADGTKSFSMSAKGTIGITFSSGKVNDINVSGTATLDTIPRTSSFTLNTTSATLGSTTVTVNISRASTSFTHKVWVHYGSNKTTISSNAATSASWVPAIGLASQTPNATSGTGTVFVETYSGSTLIGTTSKTITYTVPSSVVPTISALNATVVASGAATSYGYVQGKSKCQLSISGAAGAHGSTIKSYKITGNGGTWTTSSATTGVLNTSGTITFSATVTDSRGRTSAAKSVSITVQGYTPPNISAFSAIRALSTGTASETGTYAKASTTFSYASLGNKNTASARIEYRPTTATNWTNAGAITSGGSLVIGGGGISTANAYEVRVIVSDAFSTASKTVVINAQFVTLDLKAGGKGVAFGKTATADNLFEVSMRAQFDDMVTMRKGSWVSQHHANVGNTGALKIANLTIISPYANQPIMFEVVQRGIVTVATISIQFKSTDNKDPGLNSFQTTGGITAKLVRGGTSSWDLYVKKSEGHDDMSILSIKMGHYMNGKIIITLLDEYVASMPS